MNVLFGLRIWFDDLFFRLQDGLLGRSFLPAECVDKRIVDEPCALFSQQTTHQKVLLFLDELHPLLGQLHSLAGEVPLNRLQLSLRVLAGVPDLNIVRAARIFEDGALERSEGIVLWLRYKVDKGRIFEVIIIVDDPSVIVVDEEAIIGQERDSFAFLLHQGIVERCLVYLLSDQRSLELCFSVLGHAGFTTKFYYMISTASPLPNYIITVPLSAPRFSSLPMWLSAAAWGPRRAGSA